MDSLVIEYDFSFYDSAIFDLLEDEKIFPKFFSPDNEMNNPNEKCDQSINEIEALYLSNISNKKIIELIKKKLELYTFFCPYEISKNYQELFFKLFKVPAEQIQISKYILNSSVPVIPLIIKSFDDPALISENFKIPLTSKKEKYMDLIYEIFSFNNGKIPHLENILLWFPDYLYQHYKTYQAMMYGDGPLPIPWRFFLAIMAESCYGCDYLLNRSMTQFIKTGGNVKWLESGLRSCPKKIQRLFEVNIILAFSPWKLRQCQFFDNNKKGELYWSKNEMVQAVIILSFHHSVACLCVSNGILQEEDFCCFTNPKRKYDTHKISIDLFDKAKTENETKVLSYLKNYSSDNEKEELKESDVENHSKDEPSKVIKKFHKKKSGNIKSDTHIENSHETAVEISKIIFAFDFFEKYLLNTKNEGKFYLENFDWHQFKGLKSYDCCWQNDTYFFINEFFPDLAQMIDEKFKYIQTMTNQEFGGQHVNTDPFRKAIWNYSENIYGFVYSNYDYGKINKCIPRPYKAFIKKIITNPGSIDLETFKGIPLDFEPFEYTQSSLLAIEAKFEISLIYSMLTLQELF